MVSLDVEVFEEAMKSLKSKVNPRNKLPYNDNEMKEIAISAVKKKIEGNYDYEPIYVDYLEFKSDSGKYCFKGYLETPDIDLVNDLCTNECLKDMAFQISNGLSGNVRGLKGSEDHDIYWKQNPDLQPVSRITSDRKSVV